MLTFYLLLVILHIVDIILKYVFGWSKCDSDQSSGPKTFAPELQT